MSEAQKKRCFGGPEDPVMMRYHDEEWGVPVHDDRLMFEFLSLEGVQAGLSWRTVLGKRENYRRAFHNFDAQKIEAYGEADMHRLMSDPGLVRNRRKMEAIISNAKCFLQIQKEFGSFDRYIWQFTGYKTLRRPGIHSWKDIPAQTLESEAMSKDLRKLGFRFVGPIICYAHMQAVGMVNDHHIGCFRAPKE